MAASKNQELQVVFDRLEEMKDNVPGTWVKEECNTVPSKGIMVNGKKVDLSVDNFINKIEDVMEPSYNLPSNIVEADCLNDGFKYSKDDICKSCDVDEKTFRRFRMDNDVQAKKVGRSHKEYFTEETLKQFQVWLLKNQVRQGKGSDVIKQNAEESIDIGILTKCATMSGDLEAAKQLCQLIMCNAKAVAERNRLEQENSLLLPKAEYYDNVLRSENTFNITNIAADLGMTANMLNKTLEDLGIQRKVGGQWVLTSKYVNKGYTKEETFVTGDPEHPITSHRTKWTEKGKAFIWDLISKK